MRMVTHMKLACTLFLVLIPTFKTSSSEAQPHPSPLLIILSWPRQDLVIQSSCRLAYLRNQICYFRFQQQTPYVTHTAQCISHKANLNSDI